MASKSAFLLILSASYTIILIYFSLANIDGIMPDSEDYPIDKFFHFIAYALLGFLWLIWYKKQFLQRSIYPVLGSVLSFGILLEAVQELISPFRMFDWWDLLANCVGTIVGTIIAINFMKLKVKKD